MTRIYISADIEGITGVVSPEHCDPHGNQASYAWAVAQMEREVSVVVTEALAQGASHVLVNDAHYTMTNLRLDHLPLGAVSVLSGKPKAVAMAAGLNATFDAAFYIGYHAKAATPNGVLCHTFHPSLTDVALNGVSLGEGGINAYYASLIHGVPLVLASGDNTFCREIKQLSPSVETVETKIGLGFAAAQHHPVEAVTEQYQQAVSRVFSQQTQWKKQCLSLPPPYELQLTLVHPVCVDTILLIPGWQRTGGLTVTQTFTDFHTLYLGLQSAYGILSYAKAYY